MCFTKHCMDLKAEPQYLVVFCKSFVIEYYHTTFDEMGFSRFVDLLMYRTTCIHYNTF